VQFYEDTADVADGFGPSAVTIGKFDGVHVGHRAVIAHLERTAREHDLVATVVTFDRHPLNVIDPPHVPPALTSTAQRRELLEDAGVDATLLLRFDQELQSKSPEAFVSEILVDTLHARLVFVGSDFRFGAKGAGDVSLLRVLGEQHGFTVELIDDVDLIDDVRPDDERRVSSTWIRELLGQGRVAGVPHEVAIEFALVPMHQGVEVGRPAFVAIAAEEDLVRRLVQVIRHAEGLRH
jgi:riboflavin kinase/FMN adenylyltransferase